MGCVRKNGYGGGCGQMTFSRDERGLSGQNATRTSETHRGKELMQLGSDKHPHSVRAHS
jgi:hypothetical protein